MRYKRLFTHKEFPRYNEQEYPPHELNRDVWDFVNKYEEHQGSLKPEQNPLSRIVYDTRQGPFDIYRIYGGIIKRGFIVSNKLLALLQEFNLSEYVIFPGIKYQYKGELRDDLSFIYFYNNYDKYVDFSKSIYWVLKKDFFLHKNEDGSIKSEWVYQDNLWVDSYEDYRNFENQYAQEKLKFRIKYVYCLNIRDLDIFSMRRGRLSSGVFVSEKMQEMLKAEKIRSYKLATNHYFDFMELSV